MHITFTKSFGLLRPNYHVLYLWIHWPLNRSHLLIRFFGLFRPVFDFFLFLNSYDSHGLTTSFFGAPLDPFAFFRTFFTILQACGPLFLPFWSSGLYFAIFFFLSLSYCWASSAIGSFCQKWASTVSYAYVYNMCIVIIFLL